MRDIGIDVKMPSGEWDGDENCPFNGSLRLRGQVEQLPHEERVTGKQDGLGEVHRPGQKAGYKK